MDVVSDRYVIMPPCARTYRPDPSSKIAFLQIQCSSMRALKLDEKWQPREIASAVSCIRDRLLQQSRYQTLENTISIRRADENWTKEECGCKALSTSFFTPLYRAPWKWLKVVRCCHRWNFDWRGLNGRFSLREVRSLTCNLKCSRWNF